MAISVLRNIYIQYYFHQCESQQFSEATQDQLTLQIIQILHILVDGCMTMVS